MTTKYEGNLVWITCASVGCHVRFAIDDDVDSRLRKTHENFYCPFGHAQVYNAKTGEEILRDRINIKDHTISNLESEIRKLKRKPRKSKKNI